MTEWEQQILSRVPHTDVQVAELGPRAVVGLRLENFGLMRQRLEVIADRMPRDRGWQIEWDAPDGGPSRMFWTGVRWAEV